MLLYVGLTHPIESDLEEKVEESIQEWFQEQRGRWDMIGVFPYDPVLREIAIDIGNCGPNPVAESLRAFFAVKMEFDDSDFVISDHTTLEDLSSAERIEHLRHKLLYLMGSIRRLNHTLGSGRMRQIEYLLGGVATEAADLLPNTQSALTTQPPLEEGWSRQLDDFWDTL